MTLLFATLTGANLKIYPASQTCNMPRSVQVRYPYRDCETCTLMESKRESKCKKKIGSTSTTRCQGKNTPRDKKWKKYSIKELKQINDSQHDNYIQECFTTNTENFILRVPYESFIPYFLQKQTQII